MLLRYLNITLNFLSWLKVNKFKVCCFFQKYINGSFAFSPGLIFILDLMCLLTSLNFRRLLRVVFTTSAEEAKKTQVQANAVISCHMPY